MASHPGDLVIIITPVDATLREQAGVVPYAPVQESDSDAGRSRFGTPELMPKGQFAWDPGRRLDRCPEGGRCGANPAVRIAVPEAWS